MSLAVHSSTQVCHCFKELTIKAPEVCLRRPHDGCSADVWSCGIVLYIMLCGEFPWSHYDQQVPSLTLSDIQCLVQMITTDDLTIPLYLPSCARDLIARMLDKNPSSTLYQLPDKQHALQCQSSDSMLG